MYEIITKPTLTVEKKFLPIDATLIFTIFFLQLKRDKVEQKSRAQMWAFKIFEIFALHVWS